MLLLARDRCCQPDLLTSVAAEEMLYTEADVKKALERVELINYHQMIEMSGLRITCFNAGHVLGAAMFMSTLMQDKIPNKYVKK